MKCAIFIPCYNEENTLEQTLHDLPTKIDGIDHIEFIVINDGSTDQTVALAQSLGVHHIVNIHQRKGLAFAFKKGIQKAIEIGADIIAHTDGDNQYCGYDLPLLIQPILDRKADMVIGERPIDSIEDFTFIKKKLQRFGSFVVRQLSGTNIIDAPSGFRAYSRETALRLNIFSDFTYTTESIIQAGVLGFKIHSVPIRTNTSTRPSRLAKTTINFIWRSAISIIQMYVYYKPKTFFLSLATMTGVPGILISLRFLLLFVIHKGSGHIQSLILSSVLILISFIFILLAIIMGFLTNHRLIMEEIQYRLRKMNYDSH